MTSASLPMLDWWDSRLRRDCLAQLEKSEWVDQKVMDLAPGYFDIDILRHFGYNVCWWNLEERPLHREDGTWFAGRDPLVLMHYSGVRPHSASRATAGDVELPYLVHSPQNSVLKDPQHMESIRDLEAVYIDDLNEAGYTEFKSTRYGFDSTPGGRRLSLSDRRGYRDIVVEAEAQGVPVPGPDAINWSLLSRAKRVARSMSFPGAALRDVRQKAWK